MLITLIVLLAALVSGGVEWQSAAASGSTKPVPTITPQDPSSLTLALIGAVMLGVYLAVSRTIRARRPLIRTRYLSSESTGNDDERASDMPRKSRGAA